MTQLLTNEASNCKHHALWKHIQSTYNSFGRSLISLRCKSSSPAASAASPHPSSSTAPSERHDVIAKPVYCALFRINSRAY